MKIHAGDNQYICALCDQELISRNYLKRHMKIHTKDNSYKCALCGEGFISRNHLKKRMKGHAIYNPYQCALCLEKFISINHQKSALTVILGNSISVFCLISKNMVGYFFLVQLLPKIFSFANVISRQKISWENSLLHKVGNTQFFSASRTGIKLFM